MTHTLTRPLETTSSIEAVWPPAYGSHERLRGFYDGGVVDSAAECQEIAETYKYYAHEVAADNSATTRMSLRFIAPACRLRVLEAMGVELEAAIPLHMDSEPLMITYTSVNAPGRQVAPELLASHGQLLANVTTSQCAIPRHQTLLGDTTISYGIIRSDENQARRREIENQFLEMYAMFGYDLEDVQQILWNNTNTIAYAEDDGIVVSTAMAERASIEIAGFDTIRVCEITEAATRPEYRQQGLYRNVSRFLVNHLLDDHASSPMHAIYGESNLAMPGVLIAGHENGRRFSYFDRQRLGVTRPGFGILQQNFKVNDGHETRQYNDFAVSYVPLDTNDGASS